MPDQRSDAPMTSQSVGALIEGGYRLASPLSIRPNSPSALAVLSSVVGLPMRLLAPCLPLRVARTATASMA